MVDTVSTTGRCPNLNSGKPKTYCQCEQRSRIRRPHVGAGGRNLAAALPQPLPSNHVGSNVRWHVVLWVVQHVTQQQVASQADLMSLLTWSTTGCG